MCHIKSWHIYEWAIWVIDVCMTHGTYMNEACGISTSHGPFMWLIKSWHVYKWVTWVMYVCMSHGTCMNEACGIWTSHGSFMWHIKLWHTYEWVMYVCMCVWVMYVCMHHVCVYESCMCVCDACFFITNESCGIQVHYVPHDSMKWWVIWVMAHVRMSNVDIKESRVVHVAYTVMAHMWMSHMSHGTYMNEACGIWTSHGSFIWHIKSWHIYEWVIWVMYVCMSHGTCINEKFGKWRSPGSHSWIVQKIYIHLYIYESFI